MSESYGRVRDWLTNSGIFVYDRSDPDFGAVHSFYDAGTGELAFLYPEITGYYASAMRFAYEHGQNGPFREYAAASADWLVRLYDKHGGIIQGIYGGTPKTHVYSFDTAVCAKGLLDCYHITRDGRLLKYAERLLDWIVREAVLPDGTARPVWNASTGQFEENRKVWYMMPGCLHVKMAMPMLQLYDINRDASLLDAAERVCSSIRYYQNSDGSVSLHRGGREVNLHTMAYALEGLVYAYGMTGNEDHLARCRDAIAWCDGQIKPDGRMDLWFNSRHNSRSSYPIAQIIRLKMLLCMIDGSDAHVENLRSYLLSFQAVHDDRRINGGFYEEFYRSVFGWKLRRRVNSWGSMFALQAIHWTDNPALDFRTEVELLY